MEPVTFALLAFGVVGAVGLFAWRRAKQRRELLRQFALGQGWTWVPRDDSWTSRFDGTPFGVGRRRRALNVLQGSYRGRPIVAFDYVYETESSNSDGTSSTTHQFAICATVLPAWLPKVELLPEGRLGRVGTALGMQDLELESEDFNRRYRVRADDPKLASDVLTPRTMEQLLARPPLHLRLQGTQALCWETGRHSPAELLARLDAIAVLVDGIPTFVWSDLNPIQGGSTP